MDYFKFATNNARVQAAGVGTSSGFEKCPSCGGRCSRGAPHSEGAAYQLECLDCGKCFPVGHRGMSE
jgi:hypothetical protein